MADVSEANQNHFPCPVDLQDFFKLPDQVIDIIAFPLFPEFAELGKVLSDLRRGVSEDFG